MSQVQQNEESIFELARQIESPKLRADYLEQICLGDEHLKARVAELLKFHDRSFMQRPPVDVAATVDSPVTEKPGDVIGAFKLLQKIGEGGFGVVYMAEQTRPVRRKVALKVIKPGMDTKEVIARFEAERQALAMMNHPNIAKVLDGGETESGRPYFVMELVNGIALTKFCDDQKLSTKERLQLFMTVCSAIQHAHQKGVIHRDIKPSNIMITLHDGQPVPKVIDFGVSKAINQQLTERTLFTSYGQMVGTPQYMSPEQAEMTGLDIDTRSDIYSLGVVLYELLTGTTPLEVEKLRTAGFVEMQRLIKEQEAPKPSSRVSGASDRVTAVAKQRGISPDTLRRSLRGDLDWVVMKAIDKDRNRRYDTAKGFSLDVKRFLANEPVSAYPPSTAYVIRKMFSRYRKQAIVGMSICMLGLIGLLGTSIGWYRTSQAEEQAQVARLDAIASQTKAENALVRENGFRNNLEDRTRSQELTMAFDAFNNGNTELSRERLNKCADMEENSASALAWRFLDRRCSEQIGFHVEFTDAITCSAADPLGEFVALGLDSGAIGLFERSSGKELFLLSNSGPLSWKDVAISSDGQWIVGGSNVSDSTGQILVWKLNRDSKSIVATEFDTPMKHSSSIVSVNLDARRNRIVSRDRGGNATIWDLETQQQLAIFPTGLSGSAGGNRSIAFSPTNDWVAMNDGNRVLIFSMETLEPIKEIPYEGVVKGIDFSPDGTSIAIAGYRGTQVWNVVIEKPILLRTLSWRRSFDCDFSETGDYLAVADDDHQSVWIYESETGFMLEKIHCDSLYDHSSLFFTSDSIACINLRSLDIYKPKFTDNRSVKTSGYWYAPFSVSRSEPLVAFPADSGAIGIWNVMTDDVRFLSSDRSDPILSVAMSSNGQRLAIAQRMTPPISGSFSLEVWDLENGQIHATTTLSDDALGIWSLSFSPVDENILLSTGNHSQTVLWNLAEKSHQELFDSTVRSGAIISAQFSPNGEHIAIGGSAWNNVRLGANQLPQFWQVGTSKTAIRRDSIPSSTTYSCAFDSDGVRIAFVNNGIDAIEVFDFASKQKRHSRSLSCSRIMSIDISPDNNCLVASSPSGAIVFVDFNTMEEIATFRIDRPLRHVKFLDGYDRLIVSTMDGSILQFEY